MEKEAFMEKLLSFMKEEAYKPLTVQERGDVKYYGSRGV